MRVKRTAPRLPTPATRSARGPSSLIRIADNGNGSRPAERGDLLDKVRKQYGENNCLLNGIRGASIFRLFFATLVKKVFGKETGLSIYRAGSSRAECLIDIMAALAAKEQRLIYVPAAAEGEIYVSGNTGMDRETIYRCEAAEFGIDPKTMPAETIIELEGGKIVGVECLAAIPLNSLVRKRDITEQGPCHGVFIVSHPRINPFHPASHIRVLNQVGLDAGQFLDQGLLRDPLFP
jgi:hypothetical protein